jgi:two-component system, chemotaxis family, chemotaxis protein CheY
VRPLPRRTVLVVEDDSDLRTVYSVALKGAGFHVLDTGDGIAALTLIENTPPDAIVLDLNLPTLDGMSVRHEVAAHPNTRHTPVIIVTGSTIDASGLDVAALLRKPIEPEVLVAAVRQALQIVTPLAPDDPSDRVRDQH